MTYGIKANPYCIGAMTYGIKANPYWIGVNPYCIGAKQYCFMPYSIVFDLFILNEIPSIIKYR